MFSWEVQKQQKPKGRGWTKNSSAHVLYVHRCNPRTLSARCLAGMRSFFWVSRDQSRTSQRRNVFTSYGTNTSNKAHKSQYIMGRDLTNLKPYRHTTVLCDVKLQAGRAARFKKDLPLLHCVPLKHTCRLNMLVKKFEAYCASGSRFKARVRSSVKQRCVFHCT